LRQTRTFSEQIIMASGHPLQQQVLDINETILHLSILVRGRAARGLDIDLCNLSRAGTSAILHVEKAGLPARRRRLATPAKIGISGRAQSRQRADLNQGEQMSRGLMLSGAM
jgi:hypothetical protein